MDTVFWRPYFYWPCMKKRYNTLFLKLVAKMFKRYTFNSALVSTLQLLYTLSVVFCNHLVLFIVKTLWFVTNIVSSVQRTCFFSNTQRHAAFSDWLCGFWHSGLSFSSDTMGFCIWAFVEIVKIKQIDFYFLLLTASNYGCRDFLFYTIN